MGMAGAQRQPVGLSSLFFALHDTTLGARADILRLEKQQTLRVHRGGMKPGCRHGVAFRMSAAGLRNEVTFPVGQALLSDMEGWAPAGPPETPALLQSTSQLKGPVCTLWGNGVASHYLEVSTATFVFIWYITQSPGTCPVASTPF